MKLCGLLFFALPIFAQVVPGRYVVELDGEPAATVAARQPQRLREKQLALRRGELRVTQNRIRRDVEAQSAQVVESLDTVMNAFVVRIPDSKAQRLASIPGVVKVFPVYRVKPALDRAVVVNRIVDAWNRLPDPGKAGAGVKLGIIDSGIDPDHLGFQDSSLEMPAGFPRPAVIPDGFAGENKIIVARGYDSMYGPGTGLRDTEGHGTAVAMAAAGVAHAAPLASIAGAAPKAWLGIYEIPLYTDAILKALDDAVADGMDIVNLSAGVPYPYRPSLDPLLGAFSRATDAGVIVVASAGNEGPLPNTLGTPATLPFVVAVGATTNDRQYGNTLLLQDGSRYASLTGSAQWPVTSVTGPVFDIGIVDPTSLGCQPYDAGLLTGKIALIQRGVCTFEDKINYAAGGGAIGAVVYNDRARSDLFAMNTASATLPAQSLSYADGMDLRSRVKDNPDFTVTLGRLPSPLDPNRLSSFSSNGPAPDDGVKPDLVAVGQQVYTATQKVNPAGNVYDPSGYLVVDGTSFSSPIVAGSFAVLKSARPGLTPAQYRSLIINSATPLSVNGVPMGVQRVGAGALNLDAAIRSTIAAAPTSMSFGVGGSTVDTIRPLSITNLASVADTLSLSISQISGGPVPVFSQSTVTLDPGATANLSVQFAANAVSEGEYQGFLVVQGTQSDVPARIPYWYGVLSAQPANIRILDQDHSGTVGAALSQALWFQVTDGSGIGITKPTPKVSVISGGGRVSGLFSNDSQVPGAFLVDVRLGAAAGANVFRIEAGSITKDVTITGTP